MRAALGVGLALLVAGAALTVPTHAAASGSEASGKASEELARALESLPTDASYGAFVHFSSGSPEVWREVLGAHDLTVTSMFESVSVVFVVGTIGDFVDVLSEPSVEYAEPDRRLQYYGDTAGWASRVRVAQEAVSGGPYRDAGGRVLYGQDVGVAIIDSGIDGTHPDLRNRVGQNLKGVCATPLLIDPATGQCFGPMKFVDVASAGSKGSTDNTSGHGTHVAGIVAGDGTASTGGYPDSSATPAVKGTFTGVAAGATLHGLGIGEAISILYVAEAFQHIYDHYEDFTPRIRVVNGSFGEIGGGRYDANSVDSKLVKKLVQDRGVTMVFAAGNDGGDGKKDLTSSYCDDPTPGVICVANYDDGGTGSRRNLLASSSSRGLTGDSATYPDLSAPGTFVTSTCVREVQPVCNLGYVDEAQWAPWYGTISGTSMASPHVAGIVALLRQARPGLTPAQLEDVLLDNAHRFTAGAGYVDDPQNPGGKTSFDKGAGLADVPASLNALGVARDGVGARDLVGGDGGDFAGAGAADIHAVSITSGTDGVTYHVTVRDASDFATEQTVTLSIAQNVDGRPFVTNVSTTAAGVAPGSGSTAPATSAQRSGNTISFFVPLANLGSPPSGAPAHNVAASSYMGVLADGAPSPNPGTAADAALRPMYGRPYTIGQPPPVPPFLTISDAPPVAEGTPSAPGHIQGSARFTLSLSAPAASTVTVNYATANGTATAASDYTAISGTISFAAGETSKVVSVPVTMDSSSVEGDEDFFLDVSSASAAVADGRGKATIVSDDPASSATLSVNDVTVVEGVFGTTAQAIFTVSVSKPYAAPFTVRAVTSDGTAHPSPHESNDYVHMNQILSFARDETSKQVAVTINGDNIDERDETFTLAIEDSTGPQRDKRQGVGVITNDDGLPAMSIDDVELAEGNAATTEARFTVSLAHPSFRQITVNYATLDGTARSTNHGVLGAADYNTVSGVLTFAPGETTKTVVVVVNGDTLKEQDEEFFVNLSNNVNATAIKRTGVGTIINDD